MDVLGISTFMILCKENRNRIQMYSDDDCFPVYQMHVYSSVKIIERFYF